MFQAGRPVGAGASSHLKDGCHILLQWQLLPSSKMAAKLKDKVVVTAPYQGAERAGPLQLVQLACQGPGPYSSIFSACQGKSYQVQYLISACPCTPQNTAMRWRCALAGGTSKRRVQKADLRLSMASAFTSVSL